MDIKKNKYKISKVSAKIYTKNTGIRVSEDKIVDSEVSVHNKKKIDDKLKTYYNTITSIDRKLSFTDDNEVGNNLQVFKGKIYQVSRYDIMKNPNLVNQV